MILQCPICDKPTVSNESNTCTECHKVFCDEHNTVGNQWNGEDSKTEHLSTMCEECAIDYISGEADYLEYQYSDR